ncbi:MAG: hypothetical protein PHW13_00060 [Methylococcales bacterium]|nr:hypothetical protein [Methylococcales bacterium]
MNLKIVKLQLLACAFFGAILLGEWGYGIYAGDQLQQDFQVKKDEDGVVSELPKFPAQNFGPGDFAEMVERPLFTEGRKPIVEAAGELAKNEENNAQLDDWALIGVYNKNNRLIALFTRKTEAKKYLKLSAEQQISGWVLKEIRLDRVILQQGGQETVVQLRKPRKDVAPLPPARPAPPPARPNRPPLPPKNNNPENVNNDS